MKKNICYILGAPKLAGAEILTLAILRNINREEYNPLLVLRNDQGELYEEYKKLNIPIRFIDMRAALGNFLNILKLRDALKTNKIEILHINLVGNFLLSVISFLSAPTKKLVLHFHNPYNNQKKKLIYKLIIIFSVFISDRIICISESVQEYNRKKYYIPKEKLVILENAIDFNQIKISRLIEREKFVVGSIGRLVEQKGYDVLINAFRIVVDSFPNASLEIIGEGPLKETLKILSRELKLSKNVHFLGNIHHAGIPDYLSRWSIFALSSNWEGFGLVLVEASYNKLPIVVTDVGNAKNIVLNNKTGIICPKGGVEIIANSIISLFDNPRKCAAMGENGHNHVRIKYDILPYIKKLETIYQNI